MGSLGWIVTLSRPSGYGPVPHDEVAMRGYGAEVHLRPGEGPRRRAAGAHQRAGEGSQGAQEVTYLLGGRGFSVLSPGPYPLLQEHAKATLAAGKPRTYQREGNRKYLLSGLVRCAICGYGCSGHAKTSKGKRRSY